MTVDQLLKVFKLDAIIGADAETFWSAEYTLKKMATTDYIVDPRFKAHCWAMQRHDDKRATVVRDPWTANWKRVGLLCHHAHFDGLILSHHYNIRPAMYFDTLSMARMLMPLHVPLRLDPLAKALNLPGKKGAEALEDIKGVRDLSPQQYTRLARYAGNDIEQTWAIFRKLLPYVPEDELRLIDITVRMYTQPIIELNRAMIQRVNEHAVRTKEATVAAAKTNLKALGSAEQFAELLRKAGVEPPTKVNAKGETAYAFAKNDLAFKVLLDHPRKRVRELVAARFAAKSTSVENKSARMSQRAAVLKRQPIYLNIYGARRTLRWSGGDKSNWQNMKRNDAESKHNLRHAVRAPAGYKLIVADQAQIEARLNAWLAGDAEKLKRFIASDNKTGPDVYKCAAADIYHIPVEAVSKTQRFVGKTAELGLGYGAGAPKFANMLRTGQFGPPMPISDEDSLDAVRSWRVANNKIVQHWKKLENAFKLAFTSQKSIPYGPVTFRGDGDKVFVHLPNGTALRYDGVRMDERGLSYVAEVRATEVKRQHIYGGLLIENLCQALSRVLIAWQMVEISKKLPGVRIALCTHDEVLLVDKAATAEATKRKVVAIMRTNPSWAAGLPLNVSATVSSKYEKD